MNEAPLLELTGVRVAFDQKGAPGGTLALDGVDLTVHRREIVALVGPSGAGKTTLARTILGMVRPEAGEVTFDGQPLTGLSQRRLRHLRRRMHLVFQDPYSSLHPGRRVEWLVAEPLAIAGTPRHERSAAVTEALAEVGLTPVETFRRRHPHQLSGGQRQRVALARAIVARPDLVVADEPASMLDASLRAVILELVKRLRDRHGATVVFITHDLALARHVADRIVVVVGGRIVEDGPADEVVFRPRHEATVELLDASRRARTALG
ncbi:MAG: dipeptide/oligopeptide/nickel ABC transporter ATP-binding protein [Actinobacteria bacterium]|nr:dipeptide/oligopeptide/nickel ABC transporter ATP-binding protein [Actinomycetota bacterium]